MERIGASAKHTGRTVSFAILIESEILDKKVLTLILLQQLGRISGWSWWWCSTLTRIRDGTYQRMAKKLERALRESFIFTLVSKITKETHHISVSVSL